ncbi:MAG: fused MFS/spermidine synthase [Propionibacteriaceae bacterium]|nr:fused MFS/spermidine synthase [Propionibacteriaceae bacterium]
MPELDPRLVPDRERPGGWYIRVDNTDQSYIGADPTYLEFDYVQRIAEVIDQAAPAGERLRAVHVGGAGMTLARYLATTRPTSAQIVLEPDAALTAAVREVAPLPKHSGVKVRPVDGRAGLAAMPDDYADLLIVDAFAGACVPGELATVEWFAECWRVLRPTGTLTMNLTDHAPFAWSRRCLAAALREGRTATLAVESSTLKGRRFGNLIFAASSHLDVDYLRRHAAHAPFPFRILTGLDLTHWLGGALPFTDSDTTDSSPPSDFSVSLLG